MFNKLNIFFLIFPLFFCVSCGQDDMPEELGGGYRFFGDGGMTWIQGDNVYKDGIPGNVMDFVLDSGYVIAVQEPSRSYYHYFFPGKLTAKYSFLLYNKNVIQNPDEYHKRFMGSVWWTDTLLKNKITKNISADNFNNNEEISRIVDSVVTHNNYFKRMFAAKTNYWILKKNGNHVYGPLTYQEYMVKRKELFIPDELQLKQD